MQRWRSAAGDARHSTWVRLGRARVRPIGMPAGSVERSSLSEIGRVSTKDGRVLDSDTCMCGLDSSEELGAAPTE